MTEGLDTAVETGKIRPSDGVSTNLEVGAGYCDAIWVALLDCCHCLQEHST